MSFVYVAHLNAPDPVKPDDGAVAGVAGHQDVRQVPDDHHGAVIQVPRPIPGIPDAALFCNLYFLTTDHHTYLYSPAITQILVPLTARLPAHLRLATGVSRLRPSLSSEPWRLETKIVVCMTGAEMTSES